MNAIKPNMVQETAVVNGVPLVARQQDGCSGCALSPFGGGALADCFKEDLPCMPEERLDGQSVIWVRA
jgi:hypothetical protein